MKAKQYPYIVQIIRNDAILRNYCGVQLFTRWNARVVYYGGIMAVYIQHPKAPLGETRMHDKEVKFLNGLPPVIN